MTISKRLQRAEAAVPPRASHGQEQFDIMLQCLGESEVRELQDALLRSQERGFTNSTFDEDEEWRAVLADMRARIEARSTLPLSVQGHMRCGTAGPWSLEAEVEYVRRQLTQDFECWSIKANLSGLSIDDLATLADMRVSNAGVANVGWTLDKISRPVAENLCRRIGVNLLALPGIPEELIGAPVSQWELFIRWQAWAKSSRSRQ
jgi:hypothetical protein